MQASIEVNPPFQDDFDALEGLDPSFLRENPQLVDAYGKIKWDDISSLNALISNVEQIVVKYKDPNMTIKAAIEKIYIQLLKRYPLFFGYWKRFTAVEYQLFGLKKSIATLARAVELFPTSVELWCDYLNVLCANNPDEMDSIRRKFCMAKEMIGFHFLSHTFWDKYIEFESKCRQWQNLGNIYQELIAIPLHQYAKYGGAYKAYLSSGHAAVEDSDVDTKLRNTQTLVNTIWPYESKIKQSYFNLTPIAPEELQNWEEYLNFLVSNKNKFGFSHELVRSVFERCLVPCFYYEHFWIKYVTWSKQVKDLPAIVEIYQRGLAALPTNCRTFRLEFLAFLKNSFRKNNDYVYTLFTQTVGSYIKLWPSDAFLLADYLAMLKRFHFPSNIDQEDEVILDRQTLYSEFLDTAVTNYLKGKVDKSVPLQDMMNDANFPIVVVEIIKITWLVLKNTMQTRKNFISYSRNHLMRSSVTFWLTYYKFEKSCQNFTKLNKFINELGTDIILPTIIINDILSDYRNFYLLNSSVRHYQTISFTAKIHKEMDPMLADFKINNPRWVPGQFQNLADWHRRREFRENGHPGIIIDKPRIVNIILQQDSKLFSNRPPPLPIVKNLEKINQPLKYDDYMREEYLSIDS